MTNQKKNPAASSRTMCSRKPTPAAACEAPIQCIPRRWLTDTGCAFDLTSRSNLPFDDHEHFGLASMPANLYTANGLTDCGEPVPKQIAAFGDGADPYMYWISRDM